MEVVVKRGEVVSSAPMELEEERVTAEQIGHTVGKAAYVVGDTSVRFAKGFWAGFKEARADAKRGGAK